MIVASEVRRSLSDVGLPRLWDEWALETQEQPRDEE